MNKKRVGTKTDPELLRELEAKSASQELVQAVFSLRLPMRKLTTPQTVERVTNEVLDRVTRNVGTPAKEVNVFRNIGAFAVSARPAFIRALLAEPEIASAMANRPSQPMLITSREKKKAD